MAEVTYIPYGLNEISQLDLKIALADGLNGFMDLYKWLQKPKNREKFILAYDNIMSGFTGASNDNGRWIVNTNVDVSSLSPKDREIYEHAAYYIQLLMSKMTPREKELEEKQEDKKLDKFNFYNDFNTLLLNDYFGGKENLFDDPDLGWNTYDPREKNGLRLTKKRRGLMLEALKKYLKSLEGKEYDFEGTSFSDINDARTKIQTAINALDTDEESDDIPAFNALGLKYRTYFSNGGNEKYVDPTTGQEMTYLQYADSWNKALELKEKEALIKKLKLQNDNRGVLTYSFNNNPIDAVYNTTTYNNWINQKYGPQNGGMKAFDNRVKELLEKSYNNGNGNGLTPLERKELGNMIHYIRTNNPKYLKYNLTPEDEGHLNVLDFPKLKGKRILDFVRLPYLTSDGRYIYADKSGNIYFLKPKNLTKLTTAPTFDKNRILEYNDYVKGFGKSLLEMYGETPVLNQDKDILISDITSMIGDIVSLGGGIAGAAGGIATILSDLYGDIHRGKDTWGVIKNLGANIAWGAAGLIPGAKLGKVAKNAARIYAVLQSAGILKDPEVQLSWKNLIDGKDITAKDFENFKWTLHAITGGTNAVRGHLTERNVNKQIKGSNKPTIETLSGNKPITLNLVKKINRIGGRKGQKAALEAFEKEVGAKPKEGLFTFQEEPRSSFNPLRYSQRLRNWFGNDEKLVLSKSNSSINQQRVNELLEIDKSKPFIGIGNPFNKKFWTEGGPNRGGLSFYLKPYTNSGTPKQESTSDNKTSSSPQSTTALIESKVPHSKNEIRKDWKNTVEREKFTNNPVNGGKEGSMSYDIKNPIKPELGLHMTVNTNKDGSGTLNVTRDINNTTIPISFSNQKELQKRVAEFLKDMRKTTNNPTAKAGLSHKEIGKILRDLKRRGWLKYGGNITPSLDTVIGDFIKNNNI